MAATAEAALCGNVTLIMGSSAAKVIISCVSQIISTMFEDFQALIFGAWEEITCLTSFDF